MRKFNFDEIDDIALEVVRADMARANNEPLPKPERRQIPRVDDTGTWSQLPVFLRPQAE